MNVWTQYRFAVLRNLRTITNTPEGCYAPAWVRFVYYVLFPLDWFHERQSHIKYEVLLDAYTIKGVRITGDVFEMMKREVGNRFEVVRSVDGIVTIRRAGEISLPIHEN